MLPYETRVKMNSKNGLQYGMVIYTRSDNCARIVWDKPNNTMNLEFIHVDKLKIIGFWSKGRLYG